MMQALVGTATRWFNDLQRSWHRPRPSPAPVGGAAASSPLRYGPLERVVLTDGVGRTLFEEFAGHRSEARGDEETGWLLLGLREAREAVVLATLPAGMMRDASVAHVRFNSNAQVLASRIVRQTDRRLRPVGVVHTHPGSLRHPSDGDLRGDGQWVANLRGHEGVFGIGTADGLPTPGDLFASQPRPHVQCLHGLRFSWYALRQGDSAYRPLPVELTIGPDLARSLHDIWSTLEFHAERIERLYRQQSGMRFEVISDEWGPGLLLTLPLAEPGDAVQVLIRPKEVRYYVLRSGELLEVQHHDEWVDRGVYQLLAVLAARA
jgi:proteasome lid subunit RPN8/RPN11